MRDPMHEEWEAWQRVVRLWNHGDINDAKNTPLIHAIQRWGEYLVRLRLTQDSYTLQRAFEANDRPEGK
jgi:hypothetical protein